jgi:hypothetical protein
MRHLPWTCGRQRNPNQEPRDKPRWTPVLSPAVTKQHIDHRLCLLTREGHPQMAPMVTVQSPGPHCPPASALQGKSMSHTLASLLSPFPRSQRLMLGRGGPGGGGYDLASRLPWGDGGGGAMGSSAFGCCCCRRATFPLH